MEQFKREIIDFVKSDETETEIETEFLSNADRKFMHGFCREYGIHSVSKSVPEAPGKRIVLDKKKPLPPLSHHANMLKEFSRLSEIPLNVPYRHKQYYFSEEDIEKLLKPQLKEQESAYPGCTELFDMFLKDINTMNLREERARVADEASKKIMEHPEFIKMVSDPDLLKGYKPKTKKTQRRNIYRDDNVGKKFVSLDIKQGCVSVTRIHCPNLFPKTWHDFISELTDSNFIRNLKKHRNVIFGKTGVFNKMRQIYEFEIDRIDNFLDMGEPVFKLGDEVIYELSNLSNETIAFINEKIKQYDRKFFKTEFFTLHKVKGMKCYYKEDIFGKKTIKGADKKQTLKAMKIINQSS